MGKRDRRYRKAAETIAEYTLTEFRKEKKILAEKYANLLKELIQDYISNRKILQSSQQAEWNSKLVPGWSEKLKNSYNSQITESGHYQNGVVAEYSDDESKITVTNIAEPQPPIFNANPSSFDYDTPLTQWIVDGKIHPLPPLGLWWKREDWDKMFYDAFPYFDEIQKESSYEDLKRAFIKELSKSYTECMQKATEKYWSRRKIR